MIDVRDTPIQGIICDIDGTFLNSMVPQFNWLKYAADTFEGHFKWQKFCPEFLEEYNDHYENHGMRGLYTMIGVDFEKHAAKIWPEFTKYNRTVEILPILGIPSVIKNIHKRSRVHNGRTTALRIAYNTTKSWPDVELPLEKAGLTNLVDSIVTKNDIYEYVTNGEAKKKGIRFDDFAALKTILKEDIVKSLEKPNGYSSMLACLRLGIHPHRILAFEDTKTGVDSYRKVKFADAYYDIAVVAVTWGYESEERLRKANPDYIISKPKQMIQLVGDLGGLN